MDDDDEPLALSGNALSALQEFYADRDARAKQFEDLKEEAEKRDRGGGEEKVWSMEFFAEDWGESQFWYSDETALTIAENLLKGATAETTIAVVSAPSVFVQLKNLTAKTPPLQKPKMYLLEYDKRFSVFPEFIFYDFKSPLKLPSTMKGTVDKFIIDPPFLSEDCQTKAALTVRWLSKSWSKDLQVTLCTGERMEALINKLYRPTGIRTTDYLPVHSKGLSNEFFCYANFECSKWKLRE